MGLRTTSRTPSLVSKEDYSDSESPSTSSLYTSLNQIVSLHPDAAILGNMAPALTEPLSPTNKLSSSAASASPRPTAAGSPLQNNNNNNHTTNNNNDTTESIVDENSSIQTNSLHNSSSNKEKTTAVAVVGVVPAPSATATAAKGAFQLAFEQSVAAVRKSTSSLVVNGDALSANTSQMGPMCDSKSSQPPPSAANSAPLIKSTKISQIDPETAAKIITSGFDDFPSDIEEAITAEICLRQQTLKKVKEVEELARLGENLLELAKDKPMYVPPEAEIDCREQHGKPADEADGTKDDSEKEAKPSESKPKLNIISVQELPSVPQELPQIKTDSTVTASEDDNIEERLKQLDSTDECPLPMNQESGIPATPPRTPSAQILSQLTPPSNTNIPTSVSVSSLTPQSTTSTMCGSGNQKDFKDSEIDHDSDDDLLQVLKGFGSTAGNDICDLAGFLSEYAMNYEDVNPPSAKDNPLKEVQVEIEKNQQTMQRKIDFLSRRLRKLQARYMCKQASEEISGLFEWSARTTKRKNSDSDHQQLTFAEEKYHPVSMTAMRNVLNKIESVANNVEHVSPLKKQSITSSKAELSVALQMEVVVPVYDDKVTEEIAHVSGLLQAEMREVQSAIDSDATASSSGGESADEMVLYNNQFQEPLAISKRAAWRYSRDRASIASRWSWLMSQIADLEFKIRQHTELYQQQRQRKGRVVMLNPTEAGTLTAPSSVNGYRGALPGGTAKQSGYTTVDDTDMEAAIDAAEETSQGACRTRAFQSSFYRKRKLFQTANVHTISKKAARPSTIKCGCQWPLHPCALCTGRPDPTAPRDLPDTMMMSQRVALLDPGYHPVLSFPEDVPNSIFFETISRDSEWQNRTVRSTAKSIMKGVLAAQRAAERGEQRGVYATSGRITPNTPQIASASAIVTTTGKRKYTKRNHQDIHGGGSHSRTPLVANKLGKSSKKHHRQRSPDYIPRKSNNSHHQTPSHHQHRNAEQSNHHPAHSSSIYQHLKNNKIRKLSSSAAATLNQSGTHHHSNSINPNHPYVNHSQHSYNNELNFLHCDSLDGSTPTNGLMGTAGRSRTSSPTHGSGGNYKYERSLERKSRVSYDIDNIVIPYSVAAATRVEVLPYKEIPTPKWRIVDYDGEEIDTVTVENSKEGEKKCESTEDICSSNPDAKLNDTEVKSKTEEAKPPFTSKIGEYDDDDEEEGDEDISNEAMILRHERALTEERRKFQTFLKFPWSTRSRANRRIDSRAESSGTNTPDPSSPAPNTPSVGGDQESIPSPLAPSTPVTPLDSIAEGGENSSNLSNPVTLTGMPSITSILNSISKRQERRRTVSTKKDNKDDQRRSSTPDIREQIPPYDPLVFPIPNDLFGSMLRMMPGGYPSPHEDCRESGTTTAGASSATITNGVITDPPTVITPKMFYDLKPDNNNRNAFLTLNNQKSIEHVTAEDEYADFAGSINGGGVDIDSQIGIMRAPPPIHTLLPGMTKEMEFSPFTCRNNLLGCSDTESLDSETGDDDPNDPEWKDEPE